MYLRLNWRLVIAEVYESPSCISQWLYLKIVHQDSSPNCGCQSDIIFPRHFGFFLLLVKKWWSHDNKSDGNYILGINHKFMKYSRYNKMICYIILLAKTWLFYLGCERNKIGRTRKMPHWGTCSPLWIDMIATTMGHHRRCLQMSWC